MLHSGAALSKQVIPSRNIADDFHAQGQVDSEQNRVSEPAGSTIPESYARCEPARRAWIRGRVLRANKGGRHKMYYRVPIQVDAPPSWRWKSSVLSSLNSLFQWFRFYHAFPLERLRVFSSCSREALNEQLTQENEGFGSSSVMAAQFLRERMIRPPEGNVKTQGKWRLYTSLCK